MKRSRMCLPAVVTAVAALSIPAIASGSGYPTSLGKHAFETDVSTNLSGGGKIDIVAATDKHGRIAHVYAGDWSLNASCAQMPHYVLETDGGGQIVGGVAPSVSASGRFTYQFLFDDTQITMTVTGQFAGKGKRVSGTVTLVNATPGDIGGDTGCTLPSTPQTYSTKLHWTKTAY